MGENPSLCRKASIGGYDALNVRNEGRIKGCFVTEHPEFTC